jgi:hypothetical protein
MDENLSSILSSIMNNPVSNWARRMGSKMAGGGDPVANYEPSPSMNMDWSKVRATQRPGYKREPSPYDESAITKLAEGRTVGFEDFAFPKNEKMPDAVQRQEGMGLNNIAGRHGSFPLTEPPFGASGTLDTVLPEMGYDYTNEGYDFATPELGSMGPPRGGGNMVGLGDYQDRFNIAEDERVPTTSPLEQENADLASSWQTPGLEQAPLVGNQFGHEPGGEDFRSSEYMARAAQPEEVGGGQGFDLLGWLNKLPSGARKREQDIARPDFGSKRPGTTYDGSIQGGGYFTPKEYGRHYSQYGRGS